MNFKKTCLGLLGGAVTLAAAGSAQAAFVVVSSQASQNNSDFAIISESQRWTKDNVYILDKVIYVNNGAVITIEPGTIVRGEPAKAGEFDPGALVIDRGSQIIAMGTPSEPIIFTSLDDPYVPGGSATIPNVVQSDLPASGDNILNPRTYDRDVEIDPNDAVTGGISPENIFAIDGLWGGLIMLGRTRLGFNNSDGGEWTPNAPFAIASDDDDPVINPPEEGTGATFIEGLERQEGLGIYGGNQDEDSSGIMRFCSIRFAGFNLATDNEINALTMGAVGRRTILEFIEVYNQNDDDFEWFGGNVNSKYLAALFGGDDGFDKDQGYHGQEQFIFQIQNNETILGQDDPYGELAFTTGRGDKGDNMGEFDGPEDGDLGLTRNGKPLSIWEIWNGTFIGMGPGQKDRGLNNNFGPNFKSGGGGKVHNSIYTEAVDAGVWIDGSANPHVTSGNAVARFIYERQTGGEFDAFGGAGAAGSADSVFRNNMWWSTGVPGGVSTLDDLLFWMRHDEDETAVSAPAVFGINENYNQAPMSNYFLFAIAPGSRPGGQSAIATPRFDVDDSAFEYTTDDTPATDFGRFADDGTALPIGMVEHGNQLNTDPGLVDIFRIANNGTPDATSNFDGLGTLDPRLEEGAPARSQGEWESSTLAGFAYPPNDGFYTMVDFRGAFRDNLWLKTWSILDRVGSSAYAGADVLSATKNPATPVPSLSPATDGVDVAFQTEAGILYSVERSTNRASYTPVDTVLGDGTELVFNDTGANAGQVVFYRIIPL